MKTKKPFITNQEFCPLGELIKSKYLKPNGLKQIDLAERLGLSKQATHMILMGDMKMPIWAMVKLFIMSGIPMSSMMKKQEKIYPTKIAKRLKEKLKKQNAKKETK